MTQKGSVIFIILIGIALFAALSLAVVNSGKNVGEGDDEQMLVLSSQMMQYALDVQTGIRRIKAVNGCSDSQISFERPPFDGTDTDYYYDNGKSDFSCHVFHINGGKVESMPKLPSGLNDGSAAFFTGHTCVPSLKKGDVDPGVSDNCIAADGMDILFIIPNIYRAACLLINDRAGIAAISGEPPQDHADGWATAAGQYYTGSFPSSGNHAITDSSGGYGFDGKRYGCFEGGGTASFPAGKYHFYYAVVDR